MKIRVTGSNSSVHQPHEAVRHLPNLEQAAKHVLILAREDASVRYAPPLRATPLGGAEWEFHQAAKLLSNQGSDSRSTSTRETS